MVIRAREPVSKLCSALFYSGVGDDDMKTFATDKPLTLLILFLMLYKNFSSNNFSIVIVIVYVVKNEKLFLIRFVKGYLGHIQ